MDVRNMFAGSHTEHCCACCCITIAWVESTCHFLFPFVFFRAFLSLSAVQRRSKVQRERGERRGRYGGTPGQKHTNKHTHTHTHTPIDAFVLELHLVAFGAPVAAGGRELQQVFFVLFFFFFCTGK